MACQRWDRIDRFRPRFCATFLPGLSTVPLAEGVMLRMAVSSMAINSWFWTISVVMRCSSACSVLMRLCSTVRSCDKTCRYFKLGLPFQRKRRLAFPSWRLTFTQRARPSRSAASRQRCIWRRSLRRVFLCWLASMPAICVYWCWSLTTVSLCTTPGSIPQDWYGAGDRGWLGNSSTRVAVNVLPCRVMLMDY